MDHDHGLCRITIPLWALKDARARRVVLEAFPAHFVDSGELADVLTTRPLPEPESGQPGRAVRLVDGHPFLVLEIEDGNGCLGSRLHLRHGRIPYLAVVGQEGVRLAVVAMQGDEQQAAMMDNTVYMAAVRVDAAGKPVIDDIQLQPVRRMEAAKRAIMGGFSA